MSLTDAQTLEVLTRHLADRPRPTGKHVSPYVIDLIRIALQDGHKKAEVARRFNVSRTTVSRVAKMQAEDVEQALALLIDLVDCEAEITEKIEQPTASDLVFLLRVGYLMGPGFSEAAAKRAIVQVEALSD